MAVGNFDKNFEILEFSLIDLNQPFNLKWGWWSRIFEYELSMVKPGGFLITTFDILEIQLDYVENLFQSKIRQVLNPVSGSNSPYQMNEFQNLTVGFFILRKI